MTSNFPEFASRRLQQPFQKYANNTYLLIVRLTVLFFVVAVSFSIGFFISAPVGLYVGSGMVFVFMYLTFKRQRPVVYVGLVLANFFLSAPRFFGSLVYFPLVFFGIGAIVVFWFVDKFLVERHIVLNTSRAVYAAIALAVVAVLAYIAGYLPWLPIAGADNLAQLSGVMIFVITSLTFLLGAHDFQDESLLKIVLFAYLGFGSLLIFGVLAPRVAFSVVNRVFLEGAKGSMFWNWMGALAFSQALINTSLKTRWRLVLAVLSAVHLFATGYLTRSWVSGWLPALFAMGLIFWVYFKRMRIILIILAGVAAIIFFQTDFWQRLVLENSYSLMTRNATFSILYEIVRVNPILGLGPSNYYWYTPLYSILGFYVQFNSHNQYVDLIAQTGLLGLFIYLWLCFEIMYYAWKAKDKFPEGFPRAYAYGILGGMAGLVIAGFLGDWTIPFLYNIGARGLSSSLMGWLFAGGLFSLGSIYMKSEEEEDEHSEEASDYP